MPKLSPSILTADFLNLGRDILATCAGGADYLHVDVMDGRFVPNISIGLPVVAALKRAAAAPLDVHLMIDGPSRYIVDFAKAGADILTIHLESPDALATADALRLIRSAGRRAGLSIKPGTPVRDVEALLPLCDLLLVMTVEPGFGGQGFIPECMEKIREARRLIDRLNPACELEIDGGVGEKNIGETVAAGAEVLVIGSAIFRPEYDVAARTRLFRELADGVRR